MHFCAKQAAVKVSNMDYGPNEGINLKKSKLFGPNVAEKKMLFGFGQNPHSKIGSINKAGCFDIETCSLFA